MLQDYSCAFLGEEDLSLEITLNYPLQPATLSRGESMPTYTIYHIFNYSTQHPLISLLGNPPTIYANSLKYRINELPSYLSFLTTQDKEQRTSPLSLPEPKKHSAMGIGRGGLDHHPYWSTRIQRYLFRYSRNSHPPPMWCKKLGFTTRIGLMCASCLNEKRQQDKTALHIRILPKHFTQGILTNKSIRKSKEDSQKLN